MRLRELDDVLITYDFDVYDGERTRVFDCWDDAAIDDPDRAISNLMWECSTWSRASKAYTSDRQKVFW